MEKEITKLLEGLEIDKEILSEKAIKKMALIFEAKVNEKVSAKEVELDESNEATLTEFKDEMVEKLNEYMTYFAESYIEENKEEIADAVTVKTAQKVLENFKGMVNDFHISLDETNIDQSDEIEGLKEQLNKSVNKALEVEKQLEESVKAQLVAEAASSIEIESERDSFVALAENFEFEGVESFGEKLVFLKENINTSTIDTVETLEESELEDAQEDVLEESHIKSGAPMNTYLKTFERK